MKRVGHADHALTSAANSAISHFMLSLLIDVAALIDPTMLHSVLATSKAGEAAVTRASEVEDEIRLRRSSVLARAQHESNT